MLTPVSKFAAYICFIITVLIHLITVCFLSLKICNNSSNTPYHGLFPNFETFKKLREKSAFLKIAAQAFDAGEVFEFLGFWAISMLKKLASFGALTG